MTTQTEEATIQTLAAEVLNAMERRERDNGDTFYAFKQALSSENWMHDLTHKAHGDMMPDDTRYEFIHDALSALADNEDEDDAHEQIQADIMNQSLFAWLASDLSRMGCVEDAAGEYGPFTVADSSDLIRVLQAAQMFERDEVFYSVLSSLRDRLEDVETQHETDEWEDTDELTEEETYKGYTVRVWRNQANGRFDYRVTDQSGTYSSGNYDSPEEAWEYARLTVDSRVSE